MGSLLKYRIIGSFILYALMYTNSAQALDCSDYPTACQDYCEEFNRLQRGIDLYCEGPQFDQLRCQTLNALQEKVFTGLGNCIQNANDLLDELRRIFPGEELPE